MFDQSDAWKALVENESSDKFYSYFGEEPPCDGICLSRNDHICFSFLQCDSEGPTWVGIPEEWAADICKSPSMMKELEGLFGGLFLPRVCYDMTDDQEKAVIFLSRKVRYNVWLLFASLFRRESTDLFTAAEYEKWVERLPDMSPFTRLLIFSLYRRDKYFNLSRQDEGHQFAVLGNPHAAIDSSVGAYEKWLAAVLSFDWTSIEWASDKVIKGYQRYVLCDKLHEQMRYLQDVEFPDPRGVFDTQDQLIDIVVETLEILKAHEQNS